MTLDEYQKLAARTMNPALTDDEQLQHALFEIASEVGEIHAIFQKELQGHPIDEAHLGEEIGDVLWGLAELCTVYGWHMDVIAAMNIEKLKMRYPEGFSTERSVNRS